VHRQQLTLLYGVLCAVSVLLAWRLVSEWKLANQRYGREFRTTMQTAAYFPPNSPQRPAPPIAEIVAKNLFSPDRNNQVAEAGSSQPPPPLPIVYGTVNLGGSFEALMAERGQSSRPSFRRIKSGEQLAGYTVVEISDEKVVVEFLGRKTTIDIYQSANSVPRGEARGGTGAGPVAENGGGILPPQPPPQASSITAPSSQPAASKAAVAPSSASGIQVTIEGNRRRMERSSPFGPQVWYEDIQK
jgi:hypothetical protein